MRKGYDCNAVQENRGEIRDTGWGGNTALLCRAREVSAEERGEMEAELIERNRGLVKKIALRFVGRGVELDDLIQIGTIGMLKAIRSFDTERGTQFSTYAVPLVFGEIRKHLRDEGPIKVGRYYKSLGAQLLSAKNKILAEEGREAHICELAELCEVSAEEAAMAIDAVSPIASLSDSAYGDDDGIELEATLCDEESLNESKRIIDKIALSEAISSMPPQWQQIVTYRYYRNMTQTQVARLLCLTQVKVSREEKKIMEYLQKALM